MQILQKGPAVSVKMQTAFKMGWERQTLRFVVLKRGFTDSRGLEAEPKERGGGRGPPLSPLGHYWDARDGTSPAHPLHRQRMDSFPTYVHTSTPREQLSP